MVKSCLSIITETSPFSDAFTRINEILARAEQGDASASKTAMRMATLFKSPDGAFDVTIERNGTFGVRIRLAPTRALLAIIKAGPRK